MTRRKMFKAGLFSFQKINAKNAFGLHLIDYMQDLIKTVKEGDMTNFQVMRKLAFITYLAGQLA